MTGREFLRALGRPPEKRWPDGWIHHGVRALVLVALAAGVAAMFPVSPLANLSVPERGSVAQEDVIADVGFFIYRSQAELNRARQDAAAAEKPIFVYDPLAVDSMLADVDRFFLRVDSAVTEAATDAGARRRVRELLRAYAIPPSVEDVDLLINRGERARLRSTVRNVIMDELPRGIAQPGELEEADSREIRLIAHGRDRTVPRDSIDTALDFYNRSRFHVPSTASAGYEQLQRLLLVRFLVPSLRPDWTATEQARARAQASVPVTKGEVLQGERIITARERVTEEQIEKLRAYQQELERRGQLRGDGQRLARMTGLFLFNLIVLSLFAALLYFYRPHVYENMRHLLLLSFLTLALVGVAAIVARYDAPVVLIPIAFPALVVAALWDGRLALTMSLIMAVLLAGQAPFLGITALLTLVTAGAAASLAVRVVRRRAQAWSFIALIAGAYLLAAVVLALLRSWTFGEVVVMSGWGAVSAVASAFAAMGFLPLFEGYTRITTDQTLLELADANRPLLRRLSMEAPGTYAHSVNVANLAEAAAAAIDANALLTRVGMYYHDVGKIGRPQYFIENQPGGRNPHDRLKPVMSATVVRNHITEGLRLADEARLPDSIKAFIAEHHGTQSISFFYDQARELDPDAELDPKDFCYPGPAPRSRETAIAMLADSVESAARTLQDPTPDRISELVDRIVQGKIDAEQLDEAPLTLGELKTVRNTLTSVLSGMYHQRIDYPPTRPPRGAAGGAVGDGPGQGQGEGQGERRVTEGAEARAGLR